MGGRGERPTALSHGPAGRAPDARMGNLRRGNQAHHPGTPAVVLEAGHGARVHSRAPTTRMGSAHRARLSVLSRGIRNRRSHARADRASAGNGAGAGLRVRPLQHDHAGPAEVDAEVDRISGAVASATTLRRAYTRSPSRSRLRPASKISRVPSVRTAP